MILQLENVHYKYKTKYQTVHAVRGITYGFDTGTVYAIMGKSGCGKTTLLSMLGGLMLPTEGAVVVDGKSTAEQDCNRLRREKVALIYQSYNLFPWLTVEENVTYPLVIQNQPKAAALELAYQRLGDVGMEPDLYKRLPAALSGGEQQRVAIARTLVTGSPIVLADEPTGNLDSANSQNIVEILCSLAHKEGRCVIIVTHDQAVADASDVKIQMMDGSFV